MILILVSMLVLMMTPMLILVFVSMLVLMFILKRMLMYMIMVMANFWQCIGLVVRFSTRGKNLDKREREGALTDPRNHLHDH